MYRNYEEYMRTVLGYNPGFNNTYINPYQYNNIQNDEYENFNIPEQKSNNNNLNIQKEEGNNNFNNNIRGRTKEVQNATSYKNFLRF